MQQLDNIYIEQVLIPEGHTFLHRHDRIHAADDLGYHSHPECELEYVVRGGGVHVIGGLSEPVTEGEIIFVPGNVPHAWFLDETDDDKSRPVCNKTSGIRIDEHTLQFRVDTVCAQLVHIPEMKHCAELLANTTCAFEILGEAAERIRPLCRAMDRMEPVERLATFYRILSTMASSREIRTLSQQPRLWNQPRKTQRIDRVYQYMSENYARTVTLDEIADIACMNRSAFCTFFRRATGKTFSALMNEYRVNKACLLLAENPQTHVKDICYTVGFNDVSHFNRVFAQLKGCPPGRYRK